MAGTLSFFVESYLYDLFTALNLSLPRAADFFNVTIETERSRQRKRLDLSAFYFETAFRSRHQWPTIQYIDPQTVSVWFNRVRTGFGQVPESPIECAIFAMLHVCRSSGRPEDIVWLFYAFESLFQTRVGENYSAILDRVCLLLSPDSEQEKVLRKKFRAMYDFRSAFVHGGLPIIHPIHHDGIDKRAEEFYGKTIELSQYGTKLLLGCFQRYVRENWRTVRYRTTVEPAND
jgi:Apea-like HEPN